MASCKKIKNQIYLDSMGWLSKRAKGKVEKHLIGCPDCRRVMREAQELAGNINSDTLFPSEKKINWDSFMESVYVKINARLKEKERGIPLFKTYLSKRYWVALAPVAIVLILAFLFVYKGFQRESPDSYSPYTASLPEDIGRRLQLEHAKQATADYLREGREVLLNLAGNPIRCNGEKIDITEEKQRIERILYKKNTIADFLNEPELQRAAPLCDEMETLLLDASSLKSCTNRQELKDIEETILGRNLLMKIEVITGELGYEEKMDQFI